MRYFVNFVGPKKGNRGPKFQMSTHVSVMAKSVIQAAQDLEPLAKSIPADDNERKRLVYY